MSAYVVDREHISYLVAAAKSRAIGCRYGGYFSWWVKKYGNRQELNGNEVKVGQMLWDQCIKSVMYRYSDCTKDNLPGPIGEDFIFSEKDMNIWIFHKFEPVQVLKSCACYDYQSCEDPDYENSEAYAFIESLKEHAISALPGYEEAKWGNPKI